jgi:hypothetical protein
MNALKSLLCLYLLTLLTTPLRAADSPTTDTITPQLDRYAALVRNFARFNPQEKVWLHFDNTAYYACDTIWFTAYVHTSTQTDSLRSRTLYVDLVSPAGRVLLTRKLRITDGRCHGDLPLSQPEAAATTSAPRPLPAGYYEIRAYTRTMLNYGTDALFSRVLPVYDQPSFAGDYTLTMTPAKEAFPDLRPDTERDQALNIDFYPEGGSTVIGLPGRVAYRITDHLGNPVDTLVHFLTPDGADYPMHTLHDGMGLLLYTPTATGTARLSPGGRSEYPLPAAAPSGYVLSVDNRHAGAFNLIVRASSDLPERTLGLALQHEGNLCYYDTLHIAGGGAVARRFDSTVLPTGVCQLTLFDTEGILADRLLYLSDGTGTRATDLSLRLAPEAPLQSDSIGRLRVTTTRADGSPYPTALSVAIRDAAQAGARPTAEDPRIELLLASEVRGYIHRPEYYFAADDAQRRQALDLLLMVQGWRRYDWRRMSGLDATPLRYYREQGLILNGYVFDRRGRRPIADQDVHITMRNAGRTLTLQGDCRTDSAGNFNFLFDDFSDRWELAIHLEEDRRKPRAMQYRLDRVLRPALRAYADEETRPYTPTATADSSYTLDQERHLAAVEVQGRHRRNHQGLHLTLDVESESALLIDQGIYCADVETFLDAMDLGFTVNSDIDTAWLNNPDASAENMDSMFSEQPYLWGEKANVICLNRDQTSFRNQLGRVTESAWPLQLPIGEVQTVDLYDIAYLRAHPEILNRTYSDSLVNEMLRAKTFDLVDQLEVQEESLRQRKEKLNALIQVQPKPLLEQRSAPKNFRLTYFDGYYTPQVFHADYRLRSPSGEDVRRTLYWNPEVTTDAEGQALIPFRMNSSEHSVAFSVVAQPTDGSTLPQHRGMVVGVGR